MCHLNAWEEGKENNAKSRERKHGPQNATEGRAKKKSLNHYIVILKKRKLKMKRFNFKNLQNQKICESEPQQGTFKVAL